MSTGVENRTAQAAAEVAIQPLVVDDHVNQTFRVHRSAMTSPEIHRAEIERIFAKSWLYVGHESEIPNPGDFVRRPLGGAAGLHGSRRGQWEHQRVPQHVHASRRAGVPSGLGHRQGVPCFYHAWTFDSEGSSRACRTATPTRAG